MENSDQQRYRNHAKQRKLRFEDPEIERKYWRLIELFEGILETDFSSQAYYFGRQETKELIRFRSAEMLSDMAVLILTGERLVRVNKEEENDD